MARTATCWGVIPATFGGKSTLHVRNARLGADIVYYPVIAALGMWLEQADGLRLPSSADFTTSRLSPTKRPQAKAPSQGHNRAHNLCGYRDSSGASLGHCPFPASAERSFAVTMCADGEGGFGRTATSWEVNPAILVTMRISGLANASLASESCDLLVIIL